MIIKKIKLENIRSYLNQEIELPEGTVLLSGDIGSGKSTILLAAEFALFGLEKGMGQGLLRNGKNYGSVELYLDLDGKRIMIKRVLKRSSKSVKQDAGYILINGRKEEGTATELKAKILELLNYPKDYLTKGKGLLYKYTVYTPQEEMKRILLESKEDRLHVLRKIFDIDKYKRIQENCSLFLKHLRSESRIYDERLREYDFKISEIENKNNELMGVNKELLIIEDELAKIKRKVLDRRNEVEIFEIRMKEFNELKSRFMVVGNSYSHFQDEKNKDGLRMDKLKEEVKGLKTENFDSIKNNLREKIIFLQKETDETEEKLMKFRSKIGGLDANNSGAEDIKEKIKGLDECPTCYQKVTHEYKERIFKTQDEKISELKKEIGILQKFEKEHSGHMKIKREQIESLREQLNEVEARKIKYDNLLRKKEEIIELENEIHELDKNLLKFFNEKNILMGKIELNSSLEKDYRKAKAEFDEIARKEKDIEIRMTSVNEKIKFTNEIIKRLELDIKKLDELRIKLGRLKEIESWLDKHFVNLMTTIEKNVMHKLHYDFDELFNKWFSIIIDNENLKVELDEEFTPKITQADYDINYTDLSGGEKTSVALAYRLSLNQILNNLSGEIKTKDLLILDEPTDGFSTEQLDKVRIVLDELNMKQIIIVSHEAKIESFVDKVLKFSKKEHVSEVS